MSLPAKSVAQKIISLHEGIVSAMRRSVSDAIQIGELLSEAKADLPHGVFLPWVESALPFSEATAQRYMQVFRWKDKTRSVRDLSEAYRVAQIEDQRAKGREPPPKPEPEKPRGRTISDEEFEQRKEEALKKKDAGPSLEEAVEDVIKLVIRQENEEVFREFDLAALIQELRRRLVTIADPGRRHQAINQIIKAMRELAIECDRLSVGRG
jgi:hypothetical protein